jgi:hypothetical protein
VGIFPVAGVVQSVRRHNKDAVDGSAEIQTTPKVKLLDCAHYLPPAKDLRAKDYVLYRGVAELEKEGFLAKVFGAEQLGVKSK